MPPTANCVRRLLTLRETTSALCHTTFVFGPAGGSLTCPYALGWWGERGLQAAQSESQWAARDATRPVQAPAIMSRQSSKTLWSP